MNLIEGLMDEMIRVGNLIKIYESIGPAGAFAVMLMKREIERAQKAIISGDTVEMVRACKALQESKE